MGLKALFFLLNSNNIISFSPKEENLKTQGRLPKSVVNVFLALSEGQDRQDLSFRHGSVKISLLPDKGQ